MWFLIRGAGISAFGLIRFDHCLTMCLLLQTLVESLGRDKSRVPKRLDRLLFRSGSCLTTIVYLLWVGATSSARRAIATNASSWSALVSMMRSPRCSTTESCAQGMA